MKSTDVVVWVHGGNRMAARSDPHESEHETRVTKGCVPRGVEADRANVHSTDKGT